VTFAAAGLFKYLLGGPVEIAEVVGEQNCGEESGSAGAAAHAEGDLIVKLEMKTGSENANVGEDVDVGGEDQVIFELRAEIGVATASVDVEILSGGGVDGEVEGHRETDRVEARAEIGRGRRQAELKGLVLDEKRSGRGHAG
jgi:hypothetical protein